MLDGELQFVVLLQVGALSYSKEVSCFSIVINVSVLHVFVMLLIYKRNIFGMAPTSTQLPIPFLLLHLNVLAL